MVRNNHVPGDFHRFFPRMEADSVAQNPVRHLVYKHISLPVREQSQEPETHIFRAIFPGVHAAIVIQMFESGNIPQNQLPHIS